MEVEAAMKALLLVLIYAIGAVASGIRFAHVFYEDEPVKMNDGSTLSVDVTNKWLRRLAIVCAAFWPVAWAVWLAFRVFILVLFLVRLIAPKTIERIKNETLEDFGHKHDSEDA